MKRFMPLTALPLLTALLAGCAGTVPTAEFKKPLADSAKLCDADTATVKLTPAAGVELNDVALKRMTSIITNKIDEKKKGVACPLGGKRQYELSAQITYYDEGNRFVRFMLAGLGAMRIAGNFGMADTARPGEQITEFKVSKSFAWGGIYGASNGIEDIEPAFAESVAEAIVAVSDKN